MKHAKPALWACLSLCSQAVAQESELPAGAVLQIGSPSDDFASRVYGASLWPDGSTLALARGTGRVELWNSSSGDRIRDLFDARQAGAPVFGSDARVEGMAILDKRRVFVSGFGIGLRLLDVETAEELWRIDSSRGPLALSRDGGRLATTPDFKGTLVIWDVEARKRLTVISGHRLCLTSIAFSPEGASVYTSSHDLTVRKWDVASGKEVWRLGEESSEALIGPSFPHRLAVSSDGLCLAVSYHGCWSLGLSSVVPTTGKLLAKTDLGHSDALQYIGATRVLALQGPGDRIHLWDLDSGKVKARSSGIHKGRIFAMASSRDGSRLVTAGDNGRVLVWDLSRFE